MPSEVTASEIPSPVDAAQACRDVLRPARDPFHSALAHTIEEVRTFLDARPTSPENQVRDMGASLGAFAAGRVDAERFAALLTHTLDIEGGEAALIERAYEVLRELNQRFDALLELRVPPGGSLRDSVAKRLGEIGRAFGAAHLVNEIRAGRFDESQHGSFLDTYPFARWSSAERALAPALFVEVGGADCHAPALAEFLDGSMRIVLSVDGPSPVAPLARLISPRTYVVQAHDRGALGGFVAYKGAGVAALLPAGTATFQHDPAADALEIGSRPEGRPKPVGGASSRQQEEDLALLDVWTRSAAPAVEAASADADDVAGRLAGWLIQQAHLGDEG